MAIGYFLHLDSYKIFCSFGGGMVRVLVTGASGFVGGHLVRHLATLPHVAVRAVSRRRCDDVPAGVESLAIGDFDTATRWEGALADATVVVHCAARVHVMSPDNESSQAFEDTNVGATMALAKQACLSGCRRFIFISSVKVLGESTTGRPAFTELDTPAPVDPYGVSKLNAEQRLFELSAQSGMEVVVIRPPLVYGPGVKANFQRLVNLVRKSVPLPFGKVENRRSLVGIENLVDLIATCIDHPKAAGQVFLVSDGQDVSTSQLVQSIGRAMGVSTRLVPVPVRLLTWVARRLGRSDMIDRLCGDLRVDIRKARTELGWKPRVSLDEGLKRMVTSTDPMGRT
ncbi:UDP-glucose 4-epimerase family protein [Nitrogeniibacter aestuarii]|uniref:UDP-glucose 4-epimerase family protein n=1 Tax=Nitrogeniibacter aestuarii TaxID=2815343 RepID=UPI001E46C326|nr:SDR family oxidoreductase [Nitrogeniibacter aestuarii]